MGSDVCHQKLEKQGSLQWFSILAISGQYTSYVIVLWFSEMLPWEQPKLRMQGFSLGHFCIICLNNIWKYNDLKIKICLYFKKVTSSDFAMFVCLYPKTIFWHKKH